MSNNKLLRLPFDQYSRQNIALEMINSIRQKDETFTILDVGGYKGATSKFHNHDRVTVLDLYDVKDKNYIKGDATKMSLKDDSYDFVVSFDVLEHIPNSKRTKFLEECSRVSRRGALVASPINTPQNEFAESSLNNIYKKLHGVNHPWLIEHIENVIPEPDFTNNSLQKLGLNVIYIPSNYTPLWIEMQSLIFAASKFDVYGSRIDEMYKTYNSTLPFDGLPDITKNYRLVSLGLKLDEDSKKVNKLLDSISSNNTHDNLVKISERIGSTFTMATNELFEHKEALEEVIIEKTNELDGTKGQLVEANTLNDNIINSKSYKLARRMSKANKITKLRKGKI